jgi:mannose-6-phosphate isomerase
MGRFAAFVENPQPLRLYCGVQHYDWGQRGPSAFIPTLIGFPPEPGIAYAELWIGAHPVKPARVEIGGGLVSLAELIDAAPEAALGASCVRRFGPRLPFLLKVLAAERMLSIQAHPSRAQARDGFAREEAEGIPRDADHRRYRDDNHKPELIVALGEFYALCGFRSAEDLSEIRGRYPELLELIVPSAPTPIEAMFTAIMSLEPARRDALVAAIVARLEAQNAERPFEKDDHAYWLLRADRQFSREGRRDPGVLAMLMLNLVRLEAGQGLFLDAGELHSYLEGVGVELMANSDNVLRGGLTSKFVDVAELRRVLTFRSGPARPIRPGRGGDYETPAEEFALTAVALTSDTPWRGTGDREGPDVWLVVEGEVRLSWGGGRLELRRGDAVFVAPRVGAYELQAEGPPARVFRATTP